MKLTAHRRAQLERLHELAAFDRATAVAVSFDPVLSSVTLSAMIGEFTEQADLPFKGDSRRRVSSYWITAAGRRAIGANR